MVLSTLLTNKITLKLPPFFLIIVRNTKIHSVLVHILATGLATVNVKNKASFFYFFSSKHVGEKTFSKLSYSSLRKSDLNVLMFYESSI